MIKASKTTTRVNGVKTPAPKLDHAKADLVRALKSPSKSPMYVSLSFSSVAVAFTAARVLPCLPMAPSRHNCLPSLAAPESDSEAPTDPSTHSEPPSSDYEGSTSPAHSTRLDHTDVLPITAPMRPDVLRLIDVMPDAVNSQDAAQEARILLRSIQADLEANWRALDGSSLTNYFISSSSAASSPTTRSSACH